MSISGRAEYITADSEDISITGITVFNQPGYYVTNTTYIIEGNLFDTGLDKLVYSAQTESMDPGTIDALGHRFSQTLIRSMKEKEVL